jgi:hypothetical protein
LAIWPRARRWGCDGEFFDTCKRMAGLQGFEMLQRLPDSKLISIEWPVTLVPTLRRRMTRISGECMIALGFSQTYLSIAIWAAAML